MPRQPRKLTDIVSLQVRLPEGLRRKLAAAAEKDARSLNSQVVWMLGQSLGGEGKEFFEQQEAYEAEIKKALDRMVNDPEVKKQLRDRVDEYLDERLASKSKRG
jgi:hypothetical protein